jgi:hypothetical protein
MARFWLIAAVVAVAFMVYALVDCAMADRARVRGPRKWVWLLIILLLPVIGGILWFVIGRGRAPRRAEQYRSPAPDDDPAFLARLGRDADQDERIRKLEQELQDLDTDTPDQDGKDGTDRSGRRDA